MNAVWIVLGIVLVVLVALVLIAFFVMRPRAVRQLRSSAELLARETHGRAPLVMAAAKCEAISLPAKQDHVGVGMLALTEHAVVFSAANPDRTLIVPREDIIKVSGNGSIGDQAKTSSAARVPHLEIRWRSAGGSQASVVFATTDAHAFIAPLQELTS